MNDLEGVLSSEDGTFTVVIRRSSDVAIRTRRVTFSKVLRDTLLRLQGHRCAICQGPLSFYESHVDHVVPVAAGGTDDMHNLQLTHMSCNLRKGVGRGPHDTEQERMPWA